MEKTFGSQDVTVFTTDIETETPAKVAKTKAVKVPAAKAKAPKLPKTPRTTNRTVALGLYKQFNGERKAVIEAIVAKLNVSEANAGVYFYNAKKIA